MPAAGKDMKVAFQYYLWNCSLCESFHLPLHFAEIICRNALHKGLTKRCGENWYSHKLLHTLLDERFQKELNDVVQVEMTLQGKNLTTNHIVSALTFGFWEHLSTKRFERFIWAKGLQEIFPKAPKDKTYEDLHSLIESVRRWRNRIAHHQAIFDKGPMRKYQDAIELAKWVCGDTGTWVAAVSKVPTALGLRP